MAANNSRGSFAQTVENTRFLNTSPLVYPAILFLTQHVFEGPSAVRTPSCVAGILAVCVMLSLVWVGIERHTAFIAALLLALSPVQIRYAQEVREYSLAVLFACLLLLAFFHCLKQPKHSGILYALLFVVPFIQYGLVLFGAGVTITLAVIHFTSREYSVPLRRVTACLFYLGTGGLISYFLTLRYQWTSGGFWYLQEYYFDADSMNPVSFLWSHTADLLKFTLPGPIAYWLAIVGIIMCLTAGVFKHYLDPVVVLAGTSLLIVITLSFLGFYPYGGTRQCIFLCPVLDLLTAASLDDILRRFKNPPRNVLISGIVAIVVMSSAFGIRAYQPYAEVEDMNSILAELNGLIEPGDQVYVHNGAGPAVQFYVKNPDFRYVYGGSHRDSPQLYLRELNQLVHPETKRLWLIFSHDPLGERGRIMQDLSADWQTHEVLAAKNASLYLAQRQIDKRIGLSFPERIPSPLPVRRVY